MSMVYLGDGTYIDTDDMSNEDYAEFCEHRKNLEKYYKYKDAESAKLKANMLGININERLDNAGEFLWEMLLGTDTHIQGAMKSIANRVEE